MWQPEESHDSSPHMGHTLLLFDVDGTLILSGGSGLRALNLTFHEMFQIQDAFTAINTAGRTDGEIIDEALRQNQITSTEAVLVEIQRKYEGRLTEEIQLPNPRKSIMPGVENLLKFLSVRQNVTLGLLTGNFQSTAKIKLDYFGLSHYFLCGAYGSDARNRNALVDIAKQRAKLLGINNLSARDILIVGDTPLDVACARAAGSKMAAVATGQFDVFALKKAGAEIALDDLRDRQPFLELLEGP